MSNNVSPPPVWRMPGMPALLLMTGFGFSGFSALMPTAPLWTLEGGAGAGGSGLVNGVLMLFTVLAQPFVPWALRRFGWAPVLATGMVLLGLPPLLFALSPELAPVLALSAVRGLGFGVLTVAGSTAVAELVEPGRRGKAIGAYGLAIAVPQLALLPLAPWVALNIGFWPVFILGALPLLSVPPALRLAKHLHALPEAPAPATDVPVTRRRFLPLARPMALLLAVTLAGGAFITFTPQMSSDAGATTAGLLLLTATAALARWRFGHLADRFGAHAFILPLVVLTVIGLGLGAWAVADEESTAVVLLLVSMAIVGVSYGGLQNLTLVEAFTAVHRRDYGIASAAWNVGFDTGTGLGSVLVGALAAGWSFSAALIACAVFSLLTLPLAARRQVRPSGPAD
ncbi:MFS transporter [Zhihengliuella salsuginis]|uniref:MFS transporter n=1 Tax=Zhihengliuella salsuginis TaxID=578222 RepID=A0ABQ3GIM6_9MICC|nr:MFS transporter [Zhihengliuella salsuginis]GHD04756.1 MFS transporter [Zhihengliuella salsuginis]